MNSMGLIFKLAFRNLARNRIRTLVILAMIVGAFTANIFFKGFANYIKMQLEDSLTNGEAGHIQIASDFIWKRDLPKEKKVAYIEDYQKLAEAIKKIPGVKLASPRASVSVLLSTQDKSLGAFALGFEAKNEPQFQKTFVFVSGQSFSEKNEFEVLVGAGIQQNLNIKVGQTITVIAQSLAGSMNSQDLEVRGVFKTGVSEIDDNAVYISFQTAQRLLGTSGAERLSILLNSGTLLFEAREKVQAVTNEFQTQGHPSPSLIAKDWRETAVFYQQITDFFALQNLIIEGILSLLMFFGILNTIGMSIYERMAEIGTMRALGDQKEQVLLLLICEGLLLGLIGAGLGLPVSSIVSFFFSIGHFEIVMPGSTLPTDILIQPVFSDYMTTTVAICLTCLVSVLWPAHKALKISIVDALRSSQ